VDVKVSIIMPAYNAEKFIEESIKSVISQTFKEFELIIINDGSNDNTINIIKKYEQKDSRIYVIDKKNEGLSDARNQGLKIAKGKYIFFLDSDDCIQENTLEILYSLESENKKIIVACEFERFKKTYKNSIYNKKKNNIYNKKNFFKNVLKLKYSMYACGALFPIDFFDNFNFPPKIYFEDLASVYLLYGKADKIIRVNSKLYKYRKNENSIVNTVNEKKLKDYDLASNQFMCYLARNNICNDKLIEFYKCEVIIEKYIFSKDERYIKEFSNSYYKSITVIASKKFKIKFFLFLHSKLFRKKLYEKKLKKG